MVYPVANNIFSVAKVGVAAIELIDPLLFTGTILDFTNENASPTSLTYFAD